MFSAAIKTAAASGGYQISRSLRFNSADSAYLARTFPSAGNQKTWTWSAWLKLSAFGSLSTFFERRTGLSDATIMSLLIGDGSFGTTKDALVVARYSFYNLITTQVFRDPSAWYHIVLNVDTTQATSSNRMKLYVNGQQITAFSSSTYPSLNEDLPINAAAAHDIGRANFFNGYMTEVNFIDGQALTPSSFGQTNAQTGVWEPVAYSGSYGTNGFYLNFSDNSNTTAATLGKDYSGNGNNWTPNNFSVSAGAGNDSLVDVPTNWGGDSGAGGEVRGNYATANSIGVRGTVAGFSTSNGNLTIAGLAPGGSATGGVPSTIGVLSGKWYTEFTITATSGAGTSIGIYGETSVFYPGFSSNSYAYYQNGNKVNNDTFVSYGASYTTNDVIGVALDLDGGTIVFYKNGVSQGTAYTGISGTYFFGVGKGSSSSTNTINCNFGQRPFAYTAPSGFKALCTQNLPTPTIGATSTTQADDYFNAVLYTGDRTDRTITVGFQPDWVWVKSRNQADNHYLMNAVVGTGKYLCSNLTDAEATNANTLTAFTSTGFSIGNTGTTNETGRTYVAWNWKANGAGSSNTAGSITSTVSANTTSGFSIVTFAAAASSTVGHGLGVAPSMVVVKSRTSATSYWLTYHVSTGATGYLAWNTTDAFTTNSTVWANTAPTSTVFTIGSGFTNASYGDCVAYCFAPVAGYSAFGSYTGNGSSDGPFIFTGFRPAFVLIKGTSAGYIWTIEDNKRDTYNPETKYLQPQASDAEGTFTTQDFVSNGFKIRTTDTAWNGNGITYIFMAFAENPFKYSLAR